LSPKLAKIKKQSTQKVSLFSKAEFCQRSISLKIVPLLENDKWKKSKKQLRKSPNSETAK
jgi:hypothetical protein